MTIEHTTAVGPVYLAGPVTPRDGRTLAQNIDQAVRTLRYLTARRVAAVCPHLTAIRPELLALPDSPTTAGAPTYEDWMQVDLLLLASCKAVFALPGWETSAGTKRELLFAADRGIPVFYATRGELARLFAHFGVAARCAGLRPRTAAPSEDPGDRAVSA
jgi:hypothetical protein